MEKEEKMGMGEEEVRKEKCRTKMWMAAEAHIR